MKRLPVALFLLFVLAVAPAQARSYSEGYVGSSTSNDCVTFDLTTYAIGDTIDLVQAGSYPYDATMRPAGGEVWICGASGDSVVVIDRATNVILHRIPVEEYPNSIAFTDDDSLALVAARGGDITLISTSSYAVVGTLDATTGSGGTYDGPGNLALNPANGLIYGVDWYDDTLYEIAHDGSSVLRTADLGSSLWQLVVDPLGRHLYLTDRGTDVVRVVDPVTLSEEFTVPVGDDPWGIDVTLDGAKLVVACEDDHNVYVVDTSDWSTTVIALDPDADPRDVDILDESDYAFVVGGSITGPDPLYVIGLLTNQLKDTIDITGSNPNVVAVQEQTTSTLADVEEGLSAQEIVLECYPNPFNPAATVRFSLPAPSDVELRVYDAAGRVIARLSPRRLGSELRYEATWDGRDESNNDVAAGVYFVELRTDLGTANAKLALVK